MITSELQNYINSSKASGMTEEQIRQALLNQGWTTEQVNEAMSMSTNPAAINPAVPVSSVGTSAGMSGTAKTILIIIAILVIGSTLVGTAIFGYGFYKLKQSGVLDSELAKVLTTKVDPNDPLGINAPCADSTVGDSLLTDDTKTKNQNSNVVIQGNKKIYTNSQYGLTYEVPCSWRLWENRISNLYNESGTEDAQILMDVGPYSMLVCSAMITTELFAPQPEPENDPNEPSVKVSKTDELINGQKFRKIVSTVQDEDFKHSDISYRLSYKDAQYRIEGDGVNGTDKNECIDLVMKNFKVAK